MAGASPRYGEAADVHQAHVAGHDDALACGAAAAHQTELIDGGDIGLRQGSPERCLAFRALRLRLLASLGEDLMTLRRKYRGSSRL